MRKSFCIIAYCLITIFPICAQNTTWDSIKANTSPVVCSNFQAIYGEPYRQPLSNMGWEDGIHITPNGQYLYGIYFPIDMISYMTFVNNNTDSSLCYLFGSFSKYLRDTTYGIDTTTNPFGCESWLNIDILRAQRSTPTDSFTEWSLSTLSRPALIDGGAFPLVMSDDSTKVKIFAFTGDDDIWIIRNTDFSPDASQARRLCYPINKPNTQYDTVYCDTTYTPTDIIADNPALIQTSPDTVIMFFESTDTRPGGQGGRDIWFSISPDTGITWLPPQNVSSINTSGKEHQPFLHQQDGTWFLYYTYGCSIYRAEQGTENDWDSWTNKECVVTPGNAACIGEPTLTEHGNLSFVVVYENTMNNDSTDTYDADPWFIPTLDTIQSQINTKRQAQFSVEVSPNPFTNKTVVLFQNKIKGEVKLNIYNIHGQRSRTITKKNPMKITINRRELSRGLYFYQLSDEKGQVKTGKLIIK